MNQIKSIIIIIIIIIIIADLFCNCIGKPKPDQSNDFGVYDSIEVQRTDQVTVIKSTQEEGGDVVISHYPNEKIESYEFYKTYSSGEQLQSLFFDSTGFLTNLRFNINYTLITDTSSENYGNTVVNWQEVLFNKDGSFKIVKI